MYTASILSHLLQNSNVKNKKKEKKTETAMKINKQLSHFVSVVRKNFSGRLIRWVRFLVRMFLFRRLLSLFIRSFQLQSFQTVFFFRFHSNWLVLIGFLHLPFFFFICCSSSSHQRKTENEHTKWKLCQKLEVKQASGWIVFPHIFFFFVAARIFSLAWFPMSIIEPFRALQSVARLFKSDKKKDNPPSFSFSLPIFLSR